MHDTSPAMKVFVHPLKFAPDLQLRSSCVWSWGHCCGKSYPCPQNTSSATLQTQMVGVCVLVWQLGQSAIDWVFLQWKCISHGSGAWKSKIRGQHGQSSSEDSLLGCRVLSSHILIPGKGEAP